MTPGVVHTSFVWEGMRGADPTKWEDHANWTGGVLMNDYPGWDGTQATTTDNAAFINNKPCVMNAAHEIAALALNGYSSTLQLKNVRLTINNGGFMNSGTIVQNLNNDSGPIEFKSGTFTWSGGNFNFLAGQATGLSSFKIDAGAEVDFTYSGAPAFLSIGDDITNNGTLKLDNTGAVRLYNRPTITNSGTINMTADSVLGLSIGTDNQVTIQNTGTIKKTAGTGSYLIEDAVNTNNAAAFLQVDTGTLAFKWPDLTTGYTVNHSAGTISIAGGATLEADSGINQTGGTTKTGGGTVTIDNPGKEYLLAGGTLQVGDASPTLTDLVITGDFKFTSGTINLYFDTVPTPQVWSTVTARGTVGMTIAAVGTTLTETFVGAGMLPNTFDVMFAPNGVISNICATNPAGWTASRTNNNHNYNLTRQGGGGGGSRPGALVVALPTAQEPSASPSTPAEPMLIAALTKSSPRWSARSSGPTTRIP